MKGMLLVETPGPYTLTLPADADTVYVQLVGAAGGGGGAPDATGTVNGQPGGYGAFITGVHNAGAGAVITGVVGAGGAGGPGGATPADGSAGGDTTMLVGGTATLTAGGGSGGLASTGAFTGNAAPGTTTGLPNAGGKTGAAPVTAYGMSAPTATSIPGDPGGGMPYSTGADGETGSSGFALFMW